MSAMKCPCGTMIQLNDPPFEVLNGRFTSSIIFNHGMMGDCKCPNPLCGLEFQGAITGFDSQTLAFQVGVVPRPKTEEGSSIIAAPAGFDPKRLF